MVPCQEVNIKATATGTASMYIHVEGGRRTMTPRRVHVFA